VKAEPAPQVKAETAVMPEPSSSAAEPSSSDAAVKDEGPVPLTGSTSFSVQWRAAQKTGNAVRDQVRAQLQKVFEKGKEANGKFLHGQVTDTALMAEEAESHMLQTLGDSIAGPSKEYKARFRSLVFNLSDSKNPEFIRSVITGQLHTNDLATMEVKDMASDEQKKANELQHERKKMSLMDEKTYKQYAGHKTEDGILKCPRCKSMKTEYTEVQTRSADEPTTKKCSCNNCDYRWKFC